MLQVKFNDVTEFLEEVKGDREEVEGGIVRVTVRRRRGTEAPTVDFWLLASVVVNGRLVYCEEYFGGGAQWPDGFDQDAKKVLERIGRIRAEFESDLASCGLEVRRGVLEAVPVVMRQA